jgi:hypothetical protein
MIDGVGTIPFGLANEARHRYFWWDGNTEMNVFIPPTA